MPIKSKTISSLIFVCLLGFQAVAGQTQNRPILGLYEEVDRYESQKRTAMLSQGKRYDAGARADALDEKKSLAKKYAAEIAGRPGIKEADYYYLGRLYSIADNDQKTLESMKKAVSEFPPDATGTLIQSALSYVVVLSSKMKQMDAAEAALDRWTKGTPMTKTQLPALKDYVATGYYKDGKYEQSISHAQSAFDLLKNLQAKTPQEKRDRETVYMNLVELLSLGYKKNKNTDQSLNILAEARTVVCDSLGQSLSQGHDVCRWFGLF